MQIVPAKPPYKHGIRRVLSSKELGLVVPKKNTTKPAVTEETKKVEKPVEEPVKVEIPVEEPEKQEIQAEKPVEAVIEPAEAQVEAPAEEEKQEEVVTEPEAPEAEAVEEVKETPLKDAGFSRSSCMRLKKNGITTVEALKAFFDEGKTVEDLSNFDEKSLNNLKEEVKSIQ